MDSIPVAKPSNANDDHIRNNRIENNLMKTEDSSVFSPEMFGR